MVVLELGHNTINAEILLAVIRTSLHITQVALDMPTFAIALHKVD